ncbi:hypothetical protein CONCODRAFT_9444 [Conidiobolus coronatus NRRL 28638]|uniref:F-box domain-containing protein n=1 Tax=Conidiobolus coronatus (strain ATCC 28846 / CBS 209.66 / NRRL 28638) TaxID=796925 RepID=A0A137NZR9_CONC2|nr:hypothetical protein CONCODRAFT_9444 [Conidiobolus coronatus NRRL 28638]|eukprot:KXN68330.1 hypothetical protein CONCODRAFT_9444 [Conidiobolus coronatus NRRL 28638]
MSKIESNLNYIASNEPKYKKLRNADLLATKDSVTLTNEIWNIAPIILTVFSYSKFRDLIEFSTVCKRWNLLTAHIIHRSVKLFRIKSPEQITNGESLNTDEKIDAEIEHCIADNSKYSHYIKELRFCESIEPNRAIELLETFKYLTKLHIINVEIGQDQFLCMIKPLNKLEELTFYKVHVKEISKNRLYNKSIQLPKTLTKLSLSNIGLNGNTQLFKNSINSHSSLKIFILESSDEGSFLNPFHECYPSFKEFSYSSGNSENYQSLAKIIESNPQITSLKLESNSLGSLMVPISKYLINLKDFEFFNPIYNDPGFEHSFTLPIKIKKLKVESILENSKWLSSLLKNCPELEEFIYTPPSGFINLNLSLTVDKPTKIKKLRIDCQDLNKSTLDSILLNCPLLKELDIIFPNEWKPYSNIILQRCTSLEHLTLYSSCSLHNQEEYSTLKFLSKSSFKNTLITLTLNNINFCCSANSLHLKDYSNLNAF